MTVRLLTAPEDLVGYEAWMKSHPQGNPWQSVAWKTFQESLGRQTRIYVEEDRGEILASALVVIDKTSLGLSTWDVPRGPLGKMENGEWRMENIFKEILIDAKRSKALSLYCSPSYSFSTLHSQLSTSHRIVYPEATRILDLTLTEDELLAQMKPKGRYNIRLAEKHGVRVEASQDIHAYATLATDTARRDGFRGHSEAFYSHFLHDLPGSFLLLASTGETPIAGLLGLVWGTQGIYYYGASSNAHRELMAPYLLQWEAMKYCRAHGCTTYDLFGIAPEGMTDHPWSGVSEFKGKFGGSVVTYPPEQEIVLRPGMKKLLQIKRKIIG
jgi:lipid II:glycine glycyltransferase (peptidoglycan interpeptide bridge formation enzyme)